MDDDLTETWYLLFGGSSADGRGPGEYQGRTTDREIALRHFKECKNNPYSVGYVLVVTDDRCNHMQSPGEYEPLKPIPGLDMDQLYNDMLGNS